MTRRTLLPIAALALAAAVPADARPATKSLALRDALTAAFAQNPDLEVAAIDVDIARARVLSAQGAAEDLVFDMRVDGAATRTESVEGATSQLLESDAISAGAGLTKPLSTGGSVAVRWNVPYERQLGQLLGSDPSESRVTASTVQLEISQPLLRGAGKDASRAAVRRERAAVGSASAAHVAAATQLARDVVLAYWELSYAAGEVEIRQESATLAREHQRIVRAQVDKGDRAKADMAEVDMEVALRDEEVAIAEANVAERSYELQRLMGAPVSPSDMPLRTADDVVLELEIPARDEALADATEHNPQLRAYAFEQRARGVDVAAAEDLTSPALDFTASASVTGNDDDPFNAAGAMVSSDTVGVSAGLLLTVPLGRREAKGRLAEARGARRRTARQYEAARRQVQVATARAHSQVVLAAKRVEVLRTATENAARTIKLDQRRYQLGAVTSFDVLRRQQEFAEATLRQRRARIDHAIAVAELFALTGGLLDVLGVDLK